jgi:2-polyprenyl-3-methyl-5-hydroxy-6-metoxy-1,4-benzoquinol methylase
MSIKIAGGLKEKGIFIGNSYDKYGSKNPVIKWMMNGFESDLSSLVARAEPESIHEIGCGEGFWVLRWNGQGLKARGCDFSRDIIKIAQDNAINFGLPIAIFTTRSIYELDVAHDSADLVVCCEVLEHLENPEKGLQALRKITKGHLIVSVPQEPLWCALNLVRGKYITSWGNTPGHLQRWTKSEFIQLVSKYFQIIETRSPMPWTMLLCRPYQ